VIPQVVGCINVGGCVDPGGWESEDDGRPCITSIVRNCVTELKCEGKRADRRTTGIELSSMKKSSDEVRVRVMVSKTWKSVTMERMCLYRIPK
jgi:hypothetical protein